MTESLPRRGEIWNVNFDPTIGAEIKKLRPALVISPDSIGKLPLCIVVPVTNWADPFEALPWIVRLRPTRENGLSKTSGADCFQVKSVARERFTEKLGSINSDELDLVVSAIQLCIGVY